MVAPKMRSYSDQLDQPYHSGLGVVRDVFASTAWVARSSASDCELPSLSTGGRVSVVESEELAEVSADADFIFCAYSIISFTQSQEYAAVFDTETRRVRGLHGRQGADFSSQLWTPFLASVIVIVGFSMAILE
jgi:hypothetical protein